MQCNSSLFTFGRSASGVAQLHRRDHSFQMLPRSHLSGAFPGREITLRMQPPNWRKSCCSMQQLSAVCGTSSHVAAHRSKCSTGHCTPSECCCSSMMARHPAPLLLVNSLNHRAELLLCVHVQAREPCATGGHALRAVHVCLGQFRDAFQPPGNCCVSGHMGMRFATAAPATAKATTQHADASSLSVAQRRLGLRQ